MAMIFVGLLIFLVLGGIQDAAAKGKRERDRLDALTIQWSTDPVQCARDLKRTRKLDRIGTAAGWACLLAIIWAVVMAH
jgi:hypothetical protein